MSATSVRTFLGNVGIGTDDPGAYMLDVNGSTSAGSVSTPSLKVGLIANAHVPYGLILIWSGSQASIPSGWALCDGFNNTPNLKNLFVVGGGQSYTAPNAVGGNNSITFTQSHIPSHNHFFSTGYQSANHAHYVTDYGHSHYTYATDYGGRNQGTTCQAGVNYVQGGFSTYAAISQHYFTHNSTTHTHSYNTSYSGTSSPSSFDLRPAYYALCYIMKT